MVVQDSDGVWYLSQSDRYSAVAGAGRLQCHTRYRCTYTNSLHTVSFLLHNKFCGLIQIAVEQLIMDSQCVLYSDVTLWRTLM